MGLLPPANDAPLHDGGDQHSPAWASFFEDITASLNTLQARKGVVDGSAAAAGTIGELLQTVNGVPVGGGAGATVNAVTLSLTPGDWDVRGECWINIGGNATSMNAAISPNTLGLPSLSASTAQASQVWVHTAGLHSLIVGPCRMNLTVTTGIFLAARATGVAFTAYGKLEARRCR